jgi:DNA-binding LytR/AlgR family response regulator
MIKTIIIDDEQFSIDALLSYIKLIPHLEVVSIFLDPIEALSVIKNSDAADIIFMDIDMPNLSGIDLAKALRSKTDKLVFTTSHSQYAFDAYEVDGDAFLLKPITFAKFSLTVNRLLQSLENQENKANNGSNEYFLVKNKDENLRILNVSFNDVVAFESSNNYVKIYTRDDKVITAYLTIADVLGIVSVRSEFKQFHRAFIVSTRYINYIDGSLVRLSNNVQFNVGDKYRSIFHEYLDARLLKTNRKVKSSSGNSEG